jgi:hypothetical protein
MDVYLGSGFKWMSAIWAMVSNGRLLFAQWFQMEVCYLDIGLTWKSAIVWAVA